MARLKEPGLFDLRKRDIKADRLTIFKNINGKEGRSNLKEDNSNCQQAVRSLDCISRELV